MRCQAETAVAKPGGGIQTAGDTAAASDFTGNILLFSKEVTKLNKQIATVKQSWYEDRDRIGSETEHVNASLRSGS